MCSSIMLVFCVSSLSLSNSDKLTGAIAGDKSFKNMTDQDWDLVMLVHLKGAYSCTKACWPIFRQQKVRELVPTQGRP